MTKTTYLIGNKFVRVPDLSDPIVATMGVTEKEINFIKAMREVKSQDGTYEVRILIKNYPGGYYTIEYHDIFKINDILKIKKSKYYKCRNCGTIIDEDEYHREPYSSMCFCEYSPELRILNPFFLIKEE